MFEITRQPHIRGEDATPDEIVFLMKAGPGFTLLPERFSVGYPGDSRIGEAREF
jgi:hypothetical protein